MEMFGSSECSSGCESGWTLYLDHSVSSSPNTSRFKEIDGFENKKGKDRKISKHFDEEEEEEEEEEDLSMVSDASSGPPIFNEDEACDFVYKPPCSVPRQTGFHSNTVLPRKQSKTRSKDRNRASFLDDTASSPFINFPNRNLGVDNIKHGSVESELVDYSQGFSTTRFQGRPAFGDQYGFFQPSLSGNRFQNNQWF